MAVIKNRSTAFALIGSQLLIVLVLALFLYVIYGITSTFSLLSGALTYLLPNSCFVSLAFSKASAQGHQAMFNWLLLGEIVKIVLTVVLFVFFFVLLKPLNIVLFFVTYCIMLISNLLCMALIKGSVSTT